MYTLKMSHGYVDEPEMETVEVIGTYETLDEAREAAESKYHVILDYLAESCEVRFGSVEGSLDEYYVTYGDFDVELGRVYGGYTYYYEVSVIER